MKMRHTNFGFWLLVWLIGCGIHNVVLGVAASGYGTFQVNRIARSDIFFDKFHNTRNEAHTRHPFRVLNFNAFTIGVFWIHGYWETGKFTCTAHDGVVSENGK